MGSGTSTRTHPRSYSSSLGRQPRGGLNTENIWVVPSRKRKKRRTCFYDYYCYSYRMSPRRAEIFCDLLGSGFDDFLLASRFPKEMSVTAGSCQAPPVQQRSGPMSEAKDEAPNVPSASNQP